MQDNHGSIFLFCLVFIVGLTIVFSLVGADWRISLGTIGALLSFVYFVQKQQLEEAKLIKELITEFNKRYDDLNQDLNCLIRADPGAESPESAQEDKLYDYFNLCAEEYLFYRRGYIYPEVWEAWACGMSIYLSDPRIREVWDCEAETGSYYGLDFDKIFSVLPKVENRELT